MRSTYLLGLSREATPGMAQRLQQRTGQRFVTVTPRTLTWATLKKLKPKAIYFPHWSSIIKPEIYNHVECIVFHMTDLPFGRGGSPLQNLILRGIKKTKISALRCAAVIDGGPVYLKHPLSLSGDAESIYKRSQEVIEDMIVTLIRKPRRAVPQRGRIVHFKRRRAEESQLPATLPTLEKLHDFIRMLDAPGYPQAFLRTPRFKFEFSRARLSRRTLTSNVRITRISHE